MNIFTQLFSKLQANPQQTSDRIRRDLLQREAAIGKTVFGPIKKGHDREFFRIDATTWIWQETWLENGKRHTRETKYLIRSQDVIKSINGAPYKKASLAETKNLQAAIHLYAERVKANVYGVSPRS